MRKIAVCLPLLAALVLLDMSPASGQEPDAENAYILVAGRRLPLLYVLSLDAALRPENHNTPNAIVSRNKVALDSLDGRPLGDPANLLVSEDGQTVYVINHHGSIDNETFRQHGGRGQIAVLNVASAIDPRNANSARALRRHMDSGGFGAIGAVLLSDMLAINNAENNLTEDGGNRVTFVDRATGSLRGSVELALAADSRCPAYPVPYVAPHGPPDDLAVGAPDNSFGCFPNPNGLALGVAAGGERYLFTANGGSNDVSVIDLALALTGDSGAEIHRIGGHPGAWGIAATPTGRHVIVASGGSQDRPGAGNSIAIIDVNRAAAAASDSVVARVRVGSDDPAAATHPLIPTVTPDGRHVVVPNLRADNVSIVDIELALSGAGAAEVARIPLTHPLGEAVRPKGSTVTRDGRYAIVSAGGGSRPYARETGLVFIIDLQARRVVATVTGVGNDPYGVAMIYR